jgi:hypothetical protein
MKEHILNLFPIENLARFRCAYRLLEVTGLPQDPRYDENLHRLAGMVAKEAHRPVCLHKQDGKIFLATTAAAKDVKSDWRLTPHLAVLVPDPAEHQLDFGAIGPGQVDIAVNLLRFTVRTSLGAQPELWGDGSQSFYPRTTSYADPKGIVDVFEGFSFRLLHLPRDGRIFVSVDTTPRFIEKASLLDHIRKGEDPHRFKFQHFLYRFGYQWYRIRLKTVTATAICDQRFSHEGDGIDYDVYDYTRRKCRRPYPEYIEKLDPKSPSIIYGYPSGGRDSYGAAALCFKTYRNEAPEVRRLHALSILEPAVRIDKIQEIVRRHLQDVRFVGGQKLAISASPFAKSAIRFPVPDLLFGKGRTLHVNRHRGDTSGVDLKDLSKARMGLLLDAEGGWLGSEALKTQYVLFPESLHRTVCKPYQSLFENEVSRFLGRPYVLKTVLYQDQAARNLRTQVAAIKNAVQTNKIDRGCALLVLPEHAAADLHDQIKKDLLNVLQFQCADARSIKRHFRPDGAGFVLNNDMERVFTSYIRYTAIGMLLVNQKWPFALSAPLHYDVHIGVDVLNGMAGFTYVYNGGKNCQFRSHASKQKEKLSAKQFRTVLTDELRKDLQELRLKPASIIIHRDGRSFAKEHEGFVTAIRILRDEGVVDENVRMGTIEIHKTSSLRLRIFNRREGKIHNPDTGAYFVIDERQGIVCNTGWPFRFPGTAKPLLVTVASGDVEIEKALSDVFALSQLAWSAPDKPSRYPVTTKLGDMFLRPIASESDEEAARYGDDEDDDEETEAAADAVGLPGRKEAL